MKKNKQDGKIKTWFNLAETKIGLIVLHVVFSTMRVAGLIISPIFAAKVTVALMAGDFNNAWLNLGIELCIVILTLISHDQVYKNATRIFSTTYKTIQNKIYKKAYRAKSSNFKITSKEKLLNIIGTDIDVVCNFGDTLGVRISRAMQMIITLVIVFTTNWIVGIAILTVSVINFLVLLALNKKIAHHKAKLYESKDKIYESFSQILSNQPLIKQYSVGPEFAHNYFERCKGYTDNFSKHKMACSKKDNFFVAFYKTMIFLITCFMILLVKNGILTLELYLIIVPYLLTSVELINELINITSTIEETDVSTKRINTVLNFTDEEFIAFGNVELSETSSKLYLMNVSYENQDIENEHYGKIEDITMDFAINKVNVIKGKLGCGKRTIFHLVSRQIIPDSGQVLLNDINLFDYNKNAYMSYIFNAYGKPKFLNTSIIENFYLTNASKDKIEEVCKTLGILDFINSLENKFNTNIFSPQITSEKLFILGLAMAMCRDSKILNIYNPPADLSQKETKNIKNILATLSTQRTILLFTHSNVYDDFATIIYKLEKGKITEKIQNNK